jgi:hypothetical protein
MLRRIGRRIAAISSGRIASPSAWPIAVRMSPDMLLADAIETALATFRGPLPQHDDVTFVVVKPK